MKLVQRKLAAWVMGMIFLAQTGLVFSAETRGAEDLEKKLLEGASVADLVNYAYKTNPMIQAARESWKGVIERYRVETAYPDPEVSFYLLSQAVDGRV